MQRELVAGVDIGGTKTHLRVCRGASALVDRVVPTADWRDRDNPKGAGRLLELLESSAGASPEAIGVGAHGCDSADECLAFERALRALGPNLVRVVNDAELLAPAAGLHEGIGVVAGTGSIAVGRRDDGSMLVAGGWGWILGDEGSAPGLVREAVRAVRGALDAGRGADGLCDRLCEAVGATRVTELGRALATGQGASAWGRHARVVFAAAAEGSELASRVVRDAARALVLLVERVAARGAVSRDVVAGGGVIVGQPLLADLLREELRRRLPDHRLTVLGEPPVAGAVVLARRLVESA
jgi:glucosamine kinase